MEGNNSDHAEVAEPRRWAVTELTIIGCAFDNIVWIGAHVKREQPILGLYNLYINPDLGWSDDSNNDDILQL